MKRKLLIAAVVLSFIAIVFGIVFIAVEFALAVREDHNFNWNSILFLVSCCFTFYGACKLNLEYNEDRTSGGEYVPLSEEEKQRIKTQMEEQDYE